MSILEHVISTGASPVHASAVVGGVSSGLTATGTTQATALLMSASNNFFTTVATSKGAQLPICSPGSFIYVWNGGSQALSVYGQTGESISNGAANAAFSVAANKGCTFVKGTSTLWGVNLSA